jgi:biotin transport system substrate-specific component
MPAPFSSTLAAALWPARDASRPFVAVRAAALVVAGALALTLSARAQVPFWPVPMTLQSLVVLAMASALGGRLATAAVALYLVEGALGLPVFAGTPEKGLGFAYMAGPTGGYLAGFLVAAAVVGHAADHGWDRSAPRLLAVMSLGHALIFAFGYAWLAMLLGAHVAWTAGVAPFALATLVKTLLAAALVAGSWKLVARLRG